MKRSKLPRKRVAKPRKRRKSVGGRPLLVRKLDQVFGAWIRARDGICVLAGDGKCSGPLQAGHLIRRGHHATRWDPLNVHGQCRTHNFMHEKHPELFTAWFVRTHGEKTYSDLVALSRTIKKHTKDELLELIAFYEAKEAA